MGEYTEKTNNKVKLLFIYLILSKIISIVYRRELRAEFHFNKTAYQFTDNRLLKLIFIPPLGGDIIKHIPLTPNGLYLILLHSC